MAKTVLVVDDEPSLRLLCRVNLELEGHRVLEAGSVAEAEDALARERVDVALLDVHLGGRDGLELLVTLAALEPRPRVVVLSGTSAVERDVRERVDAVLPKPFSLADLAAAVR